MTDLYIAIDPGKGDTKIAIYQPENEKKPVHICKFATRISDGDFRDDAIGNNTFLAEYENNTYKIGRNALRQADLETSKMSMIHKLCVLSAIAMFCKDGEKVNVHAAIGIPVRIWENVEKRVQYKDFMLPEGDIALQLKYPNSDNIMKREFQFVSRHVYPESQGAIFLKKMDPNIPIAVIDIGNLNANFTIWNNGDLDSRYSMTDELGGAILLSELASVLSVEFSRIDEQEVLKTLMRPEAERMLKTNRRDKNVECRSKELIDQYLLNHVIEIRRRCDARHWSLDFLQMVFIGGTASLLRKEIKEVFGDHVYIPKNAEFANCAGFLRRMCAVELKKMIPIPDFEDETLINEVIPGQE